MTYSDFSLEAARKAFGLAIAPTPLFEKVEPVPVTSWLTERAALYAVVEFRLDHRAQHPVRVAHRRQFAAHLRIPITQEGYTRVRVEQILQVSSARTS